MADAALLIIDSIKGNFEADFSKNGWVSEHVILAQTMGFKQIVVAINKMDLI